MSGDVNWSDARVRGIAAYLLPILREQAQETQAKVGHLMAPTEVPMQQAAAELIEHLMSERAIHTAALSAAEQRGREAEREACAQAVNAIHDQYALSKEQTAAVMRAYDAIRARSALPSQEQQG